MNIEIGLVFFSDKDIRSGSFKKDMGTGVGKGFALSSRGELNIPKSSSVEDILENITFSGKKKYIGKRIHFNVKGVAMGIFLK